MPSMIPVTVDTALQFLFGRDFPISILHVAAIVLVTPCMNIP